MGTVKKRGLPILLAACICVALAMSLTLSRHGSASAELGNPTTQAPEISFKDGAPLVPNVRPVIILQGSDYDMGYQYSQQIAQVFGQWWLQDVTRTFTDEQLAALKQYEARIAEYAPEFIDMFKGMAQGATDAGVPLSYEEVLADFTGTTAYASTAATEPEGCSGFAAWGKTTRDGKLVTGSTGDGAQMLFRFTVVAFPTDGNSFIFSPYERYWSPLHPAMNNKGLIAVHHGSGSMGAEKRYYALPTGLATIHTVRYADTAEEALQMLLSYPRGAKVGGLWADTSGDAFNLECRDPEYVRRSGDNGETDFLYATNNVFGPQLEPFINAKWGWPQVYVPHAGWNGLDEDAVRRNLEMWNMLHNYQGQADLEFAKMMLRFSGRAPAYPTLEAAEAAFYGSQGAGWDSKIGCLGNGIASVCLPDAGTCYIAASGRAARVAYPQCPGYSRFPIALTSSFYRLQLAANPADVVRAAESRARLDLYEANNQLRKLTYADVRYAPLEDIFNQAAAQWQKGAYYKLRAGKTTGNDAISNYSRALRGFTACQAYANQVYESLVRPPTKPEDLGLKKYWGGWGEWASWVGSR